MHQIYVKLRFHGERAASETSRRRQRGVERWYSWQLHVFSIGAYKHCPIAGIMISILQSSYVYEYTRCNTQTRPETVEAPD